MVAGLHEHKIYMCMRVETYIGTSLVYSSTIYACTCHNLPTNLQILPTHMSYLPYIASTRTTYTLSRPLPSSAYLSR